MIATPVTAAFVHGVAELEETGGRLRVHRLPGWARTQFPDPQLLMMQTQPSGARLVMTTAARTVELTVQPTRIAYRGAGRPRGSIDLVVDGELLANDELTGGDTVEIDMATGETEVHAGPPHTTVFTGLPGGAKLVEVWLPHNETVDLVGLRTDEPVRAAEPAGPIWLHHGSSISQGSAATAPTGIWPVVAARRGGVELRNLGFGGSAIVDQFTARVMRDAPADLISVKLGINVVNIDAMRLRAFVPAVHGFLDTIRDGHPDTPLVLISPIFCAIHEDTPGPGGFDPERFEFFATGDPAEQRRGALTLRVIRGALAELAGRRAHDTRLHYLDGTTLYGEKDAAEQPLPDALHPDGATHRLIGERFADYAFAAGGPFSPH
ncbi:GDSL-type esterase/lipase family protein [Kibdelosporangium phytohabitans]|uniref:Lipase n=1 Tax=Kibdelosporangium phytohabitans TaxID=860235 RepID=A0A0N9I165_9PSEU|nr:GDSL-type esterase/lipase family protein [Kibdelosporangium phytohabitans]ALG09766.1 lipase [Kibdelosporangium phytohabitans]MBE1468861.1 hypothetical protein [Kibdelosporangium phytohabitans]